MTRKPNFAKRKTSVRLRTVLRFGLISCAIMTFMVWSFGSSASRQPNSTTRIKLDNASLSSSNSGAGLFGRLLSYLSPFKPASGDLDQVRNGSFDNPLPDPNWVNGNAGASNAHYREGESIPYRLRLDDLSTTTSHTVIIEWDTRHSGVNAIDFITYYDRLSDSNPNPLKGLSGTYNLKAPIPIPTPADTQAADFFDNLPAAERTFTVYNASNVVLTYEEQDPLNTGEAQTSSSLRIEFDADAPNVLFVWGGHIASRLDWGFTNGVPNSAGGISGSPYHTRFLELDGTGGNQDRSLSAAAVLPPAGCSGLPLSGDTCAGETDSYTSSSDPNPAGAGVTFTFTWSLTGAGKFDNGTQSKTTTAVGDATTGVASSSVDVTADSVTSDAQYVLSVVITAPGFSPSPPCTTTIDVHPNPVVSITTDTSCLPTLTANLSSNTDTNPANYTFSWTGPGGFTANTQSITPTATGSYSVTVTREGCTSAAASGTLCLVFTSSP